MEKILDYERAMCRRDPGLGEGVCGGGPGLEEVVVWRKS